MPAKSKYDEKIHPPLIRRMARNGFVSAEIAQRLGIGKRTFYEWAKRHEAVAKALQQGRDFIDGLVEESLLKRALSGDVTACIFWLKNRCRPRKGYDPRFTWQDVSRVEVEPVSDDTPLAELNNYELDSKIAKLERALGGIPGEAPPAKCGDKPDTVH
jgi:hypothetical protein